MSNTPPCKDNLWAHCGPLGDALRRASEAESSLIKALKLAIETIEGLADQQAMSSNWYVENLELLRFLLAHCEKSGIKVD